MKFQVFVHGVNVIENIIDDSRDDSFFGGVPHYTFHRMRFPGRRLAVGKYCAIVATQDIYEIIVTAAVYARVD